MLSKCANPSCSTPLIYLREGKIFVVEHGPQPRVQQGPMLVTGTHLEHFWLCGPCSVEMTIIYDQNKGVIVVPKSHARRAVAS